MSLQYEYIEKICTRNLSRLSVGAGNILGLPEELEIYLLCTVGLRGEQEIFYARGGSRKYSRLAGGQEIF